MNNTATTPKTRKDCDTFWAEYEKTKSALHMSDLEVEAAGLGNPRREIVFDRNFWGNVYTPEIHNALKAFGQHYES